MTETKSKLFALDTSALLTLWNDEPGADKIDKILKGKDNSVIIEWTSPIPSPSAPPYGSHISIDKPGS